MPKFIKRISKKTGSSPGTLIHIGEKRIDKVKITVINYNKDQFQEKEISSIEEAIPFLDAQSNTWINVEGIHDVDFIKKFESHFQIHPLTLEDIVNSGQRPKVEEFDGYVYIVLKFLHYHEEENKISSEQVSLVFGQNFLISFQEGSGTIFPGVRERINKGKGRIRKLECDYLAYALVDAIVDNYFLILEKIGEKIEKLEEDIIEGPTPKTLQIIHNMKREIIYMRKQVWPIRELINGIRKGDYSLIKESTEIFFRDVYDHTIQIIDTIESYRDILSGMTDLYLSTISHKMNEVMKVLTIIATIFIPITFIAGIYGMNFKYMPELEWRWGYFSVWLIMCVLIVGMLSYFKKKKWF